MHRLTAPLAALTLTLLAACGQTPSSPAGQDAAGPALSPTTLFPFGTRQFGTPQNEEAESVAVDLVGNVYAAGFTTGTLSGQTSAGGADLYVAKFDARGALLWTRQYGSARDDEASAVGVDTFGNVYVAGITDGTFGPSGGVENGDALLTSFDAGGRLRWSRRFGSPDVGDVAIGLAVSPLGQVYTVGAGRTPGAPGNLGFARAYTSWGTLRWETRFADAPFTLTFGVALAPGGDVFVGGNGNSGAGGDFDAFLTRLNGATGERRWTRPFGSAGNDLVRSVVADRWGNASVIGVTDGDLGGFTNAGGFDPFVASFTAQGEPHWTRQFGNASSEFAFGGAADEFGNVYAAGYTAASLNGQPALGGADAFLVSYDVNGAPRFTRQFGTPGDDAAIGVSASALWGVTVGGTTGGPLDGQASLGGQDAFVKRFDVFGQSR